MVLSVSSVAIPPGREKPFAPGKNRAMIECVGCGVPHHLPGRGTVRHAAPYSYLAPDGYYDQDVSFTTEDTERTKAKLRTL